MPRRGSVLGVRAALRSARGAEAEGPTRHVASRRAAASVAPAPARAEGAAAHDGTPAAAPAVVAPRRCRACAGPGTARFVKRGFVVAACADCGCHFVPDPVPAAATYDEAYFAGEGECGYGGYLADREVILANFARRARWIARLAPGKRVLDVGAAYGFFVAAARAAGFVASGLEPVPACAAFARRELGVEIVTGCIEDAPLPAGGFDVITLFDVIEHLAQPAVALRRIRALLAPGGVVVIETGDLGGLLVRVVGSSWYYYDPPQHLTYFSLASLEQVLLRTGFSSPVDVGHLGRAVSVRNFFHQLGRALGGGVLGEASRAVSRSPLATLTFPVPDRGNAFIAAARRRP
ncbi:MAG: class I SAM-dependent methyltransferase [Thermodesulfobacteriota bacterium]